jgi:hypothetical protein
MLNVRQVEQNFIDQVTTVTCEAIETVGGIRRIVDTFMVTLPGIHDVRSSELDELLTAKLASIGYVIDVGQNADGTPKSTITDNTGSWVSPADPAINPINDPNIVPPGGTPSEEEALAVMDADPNLVGNPPSNG